VSTPQDSLPDNGAKPQTQASAIDKVSRKLSKLRRDKFFGDVTIKVKDGEISLVTITETLLPEKL
jgi:hypothetical protein